MSDDTTKDWVRRWQAAGPRLAAIEHRELQRMTEEEWQQAVADVLALIPQDVEAPTTSGLIEQQKWFAKLRRKSGC